MMIKRYRRWTTALLSAVLAAALTVSPGLALPADTSFAEFRIDAAGNDIQDRSLSVDLYRRDGDGLFQVDDHVEYTCRLNRATRDASFFIQPKVDGVWVTVDYLTDIDGNGTYELLDGGDSPAWDVMDLQGGLALQQSAAAPALSTEETYILSPELLVRRSQEAVQARSAAGASPITSGQSALQQEFPLCMVKLHYTDPAGGEEHLQTYYLEIYDSILIPFDVSPGDWYYEAVKFVLSRGYFSGSDNGSFDPDSNLTRAQLAQVLWTMGGSQNARMSQFSDVAPGDWFYQAAAWCQQEGLISGYDISTFAPNDPLSREQMISILYRYANYSGSSPEAAGDLSRFSDLEDVSPWAVESFRWAVAGKIIAGADGALNPGAVVSRAELAAALYAYCGSQGIK